jgi:hypothetical protein
MGGLRILGKLLKIFGLTTLNCEHIILSYQSRRDELFGREEVLR